MMESRVLDSLLREVRRPDKAGFPLAIRGSVGEQEEGARLPVQR